MIKYLSILLSLLSVPCISSGAIIGRDVANDGFLVAGDYEYGDVQVTENSVLTVDGGGAGGIIANNYSHIEIISTSLPLSDGINGGGVWSILINDSSTLNFSGGATNIITTKKNSVVYLFGGQINLLASQQRITEGTHIKIYCNEVWDWKYNSFGEKKGIFGTWWDGTPFDITFIDDSSNYFPATWKNIEVITPEPGTITLLGFGSYLVRKRRVKVN